MKNPKIFIEHLLESISLIEEYTQGHTREEFISSRQLQDSVIRRLEIMGEATKNLDTDLKNHFVFRPIIYSYE